VEQFCRDNNLSQRNKANLIELICKLSDKNLRTELFDKLRKINKAN